MVMHSGSVLPKADEVATSSSLAMKLVLTCLLERTGAAWHENGPLRVALGADSRCGRPGSHPASIGTGIGHSCRKTEGLERTRPCPPEWEPLAPLRRISAQSPTEEIVVRAAARVNRPKKRPSDWFEKKFNNCEGCEFSMLSR